MQKADFLELLKYTGDYENANIIRAFREDLTPYGFESYIADFFESEIYGFRMFMCGGFYDGGIDIKGVRMKENEENIYLAVQCKRWHRKHIHQHDIAEYYGNIADISKKHHVIGVYATTSWLTQNAWRFCESHERDIIIIDYRKLLDLHKEFNLFVWMNEKMKLPDEERGRFLSKWYLHGLDTIEQRYFKWKIQTKVSTRQQLNILYHAKQLCFPIQERQKGMEMLAMKS